METPIDFVALFMEYQKDSKVLKNVYNSSDKESRAVARSIYKKWGIHSEFLSSLCHFDGVDKKTVIKKSLNYLGCLKYMNHYLKI